MNVKYGFLRYAIIATDVCAALLSGISCTDDFGYNNIEGKRITFNITAPDTWHDGMEINENEPTTQCLSVNELSSDGDAKLYLHTVVADNQVKKEVRTSRGTPIRDLAVFVDKYKSFSLSGICYTGTYPEDESQNEWKAEYAYDLPYYTGSGTPAEGGRPLLWPSNGNVRFFAFAPTLTDFANLDTGGSLTLSEATVSGSPKLTYTVPTDVEKQIDLMTAQTNVSAATTPQVQLKFGHALTAVRIACGEDMLAGKISKVTISGIYGSGTQVIGSNEWYMSGEPAASYTISKEINLSADNTSDDKIHAGNGTPIAGTDADTDAGTEADNLTFMLLPQTLPTGASITIEFTDDASDTERTITGSIAGQTWEAGKIITYSVSPSSIHINASVEISKKGNTAENPGDIMPYSGVWYDVVYNPAKVEIVQAGVEQNKFPEIPVDKIKFKYQLEGSNDWADCITNANGLLQIAPQDAYVTMSQGFATGIAGSENAPQSLTVNGKTANCYLVDQAGYYSLPLVYGNGNVADPEENTKSLIYYPKHDDRRMPDDGIIVGVSDAVLCWQDAPDLIDSASVKVKDGNLVFHIRKQTLTQGNALLAVRNAAKDIIWSWHIWVTPHKSDFYSHFYTSSADGYDYPLAKYNLGWCDPHEHNASRNFSLKAVVDMSAYGGSKETEVEIGTFTQDVFKGSDAGDNTYYQWGRKDPMLGGIYNTYTTTYKYNKKGTTPDVVEFTMENKQVFNQYNKDGCNYSFCKNPGDMIEPYVEYGQSPGEASRGVTIGYAIKHPYMFITNSKEHGTSGHTGFNYRNHWHIPYKDHKVQYLNDTTHILFSAWNSAATDAGNEYASANANPTTGNLKDNAAIVTKSVYDPCPPEFQMPPIHAFQAINRTATKTQEGNKWILKYNNEQIEFPLTGVRDYALRENEYKTVAYQSGTSKVDLETFYRTSMPAFKMLTYISSATIIDMKDENNAYQVYIFIMDRRQTTKVYLKNSSNSYGLSVRPMHYASGK